jgi:hypothetical protein
MGDGPQRIQFLALVEWSDFRDELLSRDRSSFETHKKILKRRAMLSHCYLELDKSLVEGHLHVPSVGITRRWVMG